MAKNLHVTIIIWFVNLKNCVCRRWSVQRCSRCCSACTRSSPPRWRPWTRPSSARKSPSPRGLRPPRRGPPPPPRRPPRRGPPPGSSGRARRRARLRAAPPRSPSAGPPLPRPGSAAPAAPHRLLAAAPRTLSAVTLVIRRRGRPTTWKSQTKPLEGCRGGEGLVTTWSRGFRPGARWLTDVCNICTPRRNPVTLSCCSVHEIALDGEHLSLYLGIPRNYTLTSQRWIPFAFWI